MTTSTKILGVAASTITLAAATSAFAADLGPYRPYQAPPVVEAPFVAPMIWQGAYIGVNGGYAWAQSGTESEGFIGGGQLGYNWQRDRFVFGVEGDIQASDLSDGEDFTFVDGFGRAESDITWFSTIRGRAGLASGPALFYVTGGVAFADIENSLAVVDGGVPITFSESRTRTGYTVGGGVEYQFSQNWTAKAEYLYLDFGSESVDGFDAAGNRFTTDIDTDAHVTRLGVNYKF